eukprot:COSAG01_NODE_35806_length_526_cov_1.088993_2_plen_31_part_01
MDISQTGGDVLGGLMPPNVKLHHVCLQLYEL